MKIVKVLGGLGNQMFQFVFYKALEKQFPEERILLDLHCFNGYPLHHGFEIHRIFGARYEQANWKDVCKVAWPYPDYQTWRIGSRLLPHRKTMLIENRLFAYESQALKDPAIQYYDGYWQHEEYFKSLRQDILKTFRFPKLQDERNKLLAQKILGHQALSIHVRRGDYTSNSLYKDICTADYYRQAIARMLPECQPDLICIFSDDIPWCKEHLETMIEDISHEYVDWNHDDHYYIDMQLMSLCHHHIIANSSFSWWGAWLCESPDQKVCAPRKWINREEFHSPVLQDWILI